MRRLMLAPVLGGVIVLCAGQALAFQCPTLAAKIDTLTAIRFDPTAADAKVQKNEVMRLHNEGKHADAEKLANEVLEKLK